MMRAEDIMPEHLLAAQGYLFVCPENLATMSGMMKEMFDRCYYAVLGQLEGGDVALDESIALYERGAKLKARCEKKLKEAEEKVAAITLATSASRVLFIGF